MLIQIDLLKSFCRAKKINFLCLGMKQIDRFWECAIMIITQPLADRLESNIYETESEIISFYSHHTLVLDLKIIWDLTSICYNITHLKRVPPLSPSGHLSRGKSLFICVFPDNVQWSMYRVSGKYCTIILFTAEVSMFSLCSRAGGGRICLLRRYSTSVHLNEYTVTQLWGSFITITFRAREKNYF